MILQKFFKYRKGFFMTRRHLEIFVAVYQKANMTRAAESMHLAQPSVSLAIRELEQHYRIRLFDRIGKHIYPTDSGKRFYGYALHIVSLFQDLEENARSLERTGTLRIGSSITIGNYVLPDLLKIFQKDFPAIRTEAVILNSAAIEQAILDNRIDLGLIETETHSRQIQRLSFLEDRLCVIVSPDHPLVRNPPSSFRQLADFPFLMRERGSAGREIVEGLFELYQLSLTPLWESASTQAIVRGVANGLGIAILPWLLVKQDVQHGCVKVIEVPDLKLSRYFYLAWHQNKYLTLGAKHLMELCLSHSFLAHS